MKRYFIFSCIPIFLLIISVFTPILPNKVVSAATNSSTSKTIAAAATKYCKATEPGPDTIADEATGTKQTAPLVAACETAYKYEKGTSKSLDEASYCTTGSDINGNEAGCVNGWNGAANNIQTGTVAAKAAKAAQTICGGYTGEQLVLCNKEMTNYQQCESYAYASSTQEATACFNGAWAKYNGKSDTCSGKYSSACKSGYNSTQINPSLTTTKTTPGEATPATCESSGWNLSWIVCPVINWAADTADGIYNKLVLPLLKYQPVDLTNSSSDNTHTYAIWSGFRTYGDIFLIIALLVTVFAEAFGGGLIDAYTVKKILPRLLVAAVLINLSIYIVALAVDATNIIGGGVQNLIQAPFSNIKACSDATVSNGTLNCFHFYLNGASSDSLGIVGLVGGTAGAGIIWGLAHTAGATAAAGATTLATDFIAGLAITVVLPAVLTFLAILITLIIRQGLILLLILISPVAFALYCLPNTEKYFRQWWDLLFRTLLIYPIIGVAFAIANILAITIGTTTKGAGNILASFLSIFVMFIPLVMIPYAFRIAGGVIGRTHDAVTGLRDKGHKTLQEKLRGENSWYGRRKQQQAKNVADWRAGVYQKGLQNTGPVGFAQRALIGGRRSFENQSAMNALADKRISDLSASGNDDLARASTITTSTLRGTDREHRNNNTGEMEYQAATGQWFTERQINEGHNLFNSNADRQAAFKLVMSKTLTETPEYQDRVADDFLAYANENNMDSRAAGGAWAGIAIPNQGMRADMRFTSIKGEAGKLTKETNSAGLLNMLGTNTGFNLATQQEGSFKTAQAAWDDQVKALNSAETTMEEKNRIQQRLTNTYNNLNKFVGPRNAQARNAQPQVRIDENGEPMNIGGASSASWKTAQAALDLRNHINSTINSESSLGFLRNSGESNPDQNQS